MYVFVCSMHVCAHVRVRAPLTFMLWPTTQSSGPWQCPPGLRRKPRLTVSLKEIKVESFTCGGALEFVEQSEIDM